MNDERRRLIEFASSRIELVFNEVGVVNPMWHAVTAKGETLLIPAPSGDKDLDTALVKAMFILNDVRSYVFVSEIWQAAVSEEEFAVMDRPGSGGVKMHPRRVEKLILAAENANGVTIAYRAIERRPGKKPRLGTLEWVEGSFEFRQFVGILPRRGALQ